MQILALNDMKPDANLNYYMIEDFHSADDLNNRADNIYEYKESVKSKILKL